MNEFIESSTPPFYVSSPSQEIQLWGTRGDYGDVDLAGVSIHWPDEWLEYNPDHTADDEDSEPPRSLRLETAWDLAQEAGVPLFWVGDFNTSWRTLSGTAEIGQIVRNSGNFESDTDQYEIEPEGSPNGSSHMERRLQEIMGTSLGDHGTDKEKNQTLTPVQEWVRRSMPESYIVMDVDILIGDQDGNARGLVELRRSDWPENSVQDWWPWFSDRRQYYLLADTGNRADIESIVIQHTKGRIKDDSNVGYYSDLGHEVYNYEEISSKYDWYASEGKARQWLNFDVEYMPASEAVDRLTHL